MKTIIMIIILTIAGYFLIKEWKECNDLKGILVKGLGGNVCMVGVK